MGKIVSLLFFLSGATGLVYEVVWAKYLALVLGSTAYAYTIVLATFMGGLALGNSLFGPFADRVKNRLRLYGVLEIGIGFLAILSLYLLPFLSDLYVALLSRGPVRPYAAVSFRIILSAAILLPPTVLMGGTLPTLSRFAVRSLVQVEGAVSWLYFLNSAGAVFGTLLAAFYLIPVHGLNKSIVLGGAMNLFIGIVCLSFKAIEASMGPQESPRPESGFVLRKHIRIIYVAIFLSGCISLSYEIAWIRLLSLVLGSSTYSFSIMLAAFIAGIALGSWLITRRIFPHVSSYLLFGWAELGIGLSIILTLPVYERLPYYFLKIAWLLNRTPSTFYLFEGIKFLFCFSLLLLPTTFIGMTLPLASRVVTQTPEEVGKKVGSIFSVNTVGNVLGAIVAGLALLSILGIQMLITVGILANLLIGSVIIYTDEKYDRKRKIFTAVLVFLCFIGSMISGSSWDKRIISSGEFRAREAPEYDSFGEYKEAFEDQTLLYYKDDSNMTVTVVQDGEDGDRLLKVNGKVDASAQGDLSTQILLAQLPLCLKPEAKDVLVVGLGSGITVGSALTHDIDRLDVVEISGAVVEAERFFQSYNYNPLQDPRLHLQIEDAKTALKLTPRRFDVIISEPSNPWVAGIGNLFSVEFYRQVQTHLNEKGIIVQWVQLYEMSNDVFKMILRTFTSVFKHVTMWEIGNDMLLLGSLSPVEVDFQKTEAVFNQKAVQNDLYRIKINTMPTLLSLQLASDKTVREMSGNGPLNSDLLPLLEYQAPKAFFLDIESDLTHVHDERLFPLKNRMDLLSRYLRERKNSLFQSEYKDMAEFHKENETNIARGVIVEWARRYPTAPEALWARSQLERDEEDLKSASQTLDKLIEMQPDNPLYLRAAAEVDFEIYFENQTYLTDVRPDKIITYYQRLINLNTNSQALINFNLAQVYEAVHEYQKALQFLETAVKIAMGDEEKELTLDTIWIAAAKVAKKMNNPSMALNYARKAVNHDQNNEEAHDIMECLLEIVSGPVIMENN